LESLKVTLFISIFAEVHTESFNITREKTLLQIAATPSNQQIVFERLLQGNLFYDSFRMVRSCSFVVSLPRISERMSSVNENPRVQLFWFEIDVSC